MLQANHSGGVKSMADLTQAGVMPQSSCSWKQYYIGAKNQEGLSSILAEILQHDIFGYHGVTLSSTIILTRKYDALYGNAIWQGFDPLSCSYNCLWSISGMKFVVRLTASSHCQYGSSFKELGIVLSHHSQILYYYSIRLLLQSTLITSVYFGLSHLSEWERWQLPLMSYYY